MGAWLDERVAVFVDAPHRRAAQIILAETGRRLYVTLPEWERWRTEPELVAPALHPLERDALRAALGPERIHKHPFEVVAHG